MIIATAGHVDHGKTSLIAALTGVDTDRLPEERKRGLSIDLGFAYLPVNKFIAESQSNNPAESVPVAQGALAGDSQTLGFIDVPGHEKFIRNMIAGVGSVDLALLVIAADDGPMPQTREHLAIVRLLGVRQVVVVVTKIDLVEPARLEQVRVLVQQLLDDTPFAHAPVYEVSTMISPNGTRHPAIDQLRSHLEESAVRVEQRRDHGHFRLAVDRSFSVTGAGTIVTGTVVSGSVQVDDVLSLLSSSKQVRVRGIHAQNKQAMQASVGERCALNLTGSELRKNAVLRGDWVSSNSALTAVRTIDVMVAPIVSEAQSADVKKPSHLQSLAHWTSAHLHLGTVSVPCRIALLETDALAHGCSGLARLICDRPLGAVHGDRFVLRDQSAQYTIAGGYVLDPLPPRRGRSRPERLQILRALDQPDAALALRELLRVSSYGVDLRQFCAISNLRDDKITSVLEVNDVVDIESGGERWGVTSAHWRSLNQLALQTLTDWHSENPHALGADQDQLMRALGRGLSETVLRHMLGAMLAEKTLIKRAAVYTLPGWQVSMEKDHEKYWGKLKTLLYEAGPTAPRVVEIADALTLPRDEVTRLLNACVAHGRLYRVSQNRYYRPDELQQLADIGEALAKVNNFTVAAYRDTSGIGRNLVIELLEFFDRVQFTRRMGQNRVVLRSAESVFGGY
ncbi:selenocysteine-specific translation elongation factor [Chromatiales bacterium (ex Bugula neritina AB1)]|nr:selenocysteine-specific translation elongation factor [Chromatiales bacterium (ex Bugula neritina AB1)]